MIQKESGFSRTQINLAKAGAYYTDAEHMARLGRMFQFPKETCVLEPCIGNGKAVRTLVENSHRGEEPVHIFGVEINEEAKKEAEEAGVKFMLHADFLSEVKITHKAFSFCFSNPPYLDTGEERKERMEQRFVERIFQYMKPGGYLVLIISYPTLCNDRFLKSLLSRFEGLKLFRFDDNEYEKFKQIAFIGKRKEAIGAFSTEIKIFEEGMELNSIPYLPQLDDEIDVYFEVGESLNKNIDIFMRSQFDPASSAKMLVDSQLYEMLDRRLFTPEYGGLDIGRPVLPLKKDFYYICAVTGGAQVVVGTDENHDVHLQRGCAKRKEDREVIFNLDGEGERVKEKISTSFTMTIIENDGKITQL